MCLPTFQLGYILYILYVLHAKVELHNVTLSLLVNYSYFRVYVIMDVFCISRPRGQLLNYMCRVRLVR